MSATTCTVCEVHAESVFKVEGMDCHEEVAILERRLGKLAGLEALDADVLGQRLRIKYDAAKLSTAAIADSRVSFSLKPRSCGEISSYSNHPVACPIRSFIDPVIERFKAFAKLTVPLAGATNF